MRGNVNYRTDDFRPILNGSDQTNDNEYDVQKISYDWSPHISEKVKHLLPGNSKLKQKLNLFKFTTGLGFWAA